MQARRGQRASYFFKIGAPVDMGIGIDRVVVLRGYPPEPDRLPHQSGNALRLHLLHDLGAIDLHRSHAEAKLGRDGMAGKSLHDQVEDLDLARRQPANRAPSAPCDFSRCSKLWASARLIAATSWASSTGFSIKSCAPDLMAATAIGTSA